MTRREGERWLARFPDDATVSLVPVPHCQCCGEPATVEGRGLRCTKHAARNPCCIEGCSRTTAAHRGVLRDDQWFCGEHWRRFCPPRSLRRRTYHAHFRRAKKLAQRLGSADDYEWTDASLAQFRAFWDGLVRTARRRADCGHIDMALLERLFG